jgi:hypothetical protein
VAKFKRDAARCKKRTSISNTYGEEQTQVNPQKSQQNEQNEETRKKRATKRANKKMSKTRATKRAKISNSIGI